MGGKKKKSAAPPAATPAAVPTSANGAADPSMGKKQSAKTNTKPASNESKPKGKYLFTDAMFDSLCKDS